MTNLDDQMTGLQTSRRSVVRGAAWSIPVVAVAATAPAYAASPCDPRPGTVLLWTASDVSHNRESPARAVTTYDPDGTGPVPAMTLTTTVVYSGNMKTGTEFGNATNDSLLIQGNVGGLNQAGLVMYQSTTSTGAGSFNDRGAYTFTFSRPVTNLTFTITDVDSNGSQYRDAVMLTSGFTELSKPNTVIGAGTQANPYRPAGDQTPTNDATGSAGNVRVRYTGTISSFTITYWNQSANLGSPTGNTNNQQAIFLSGLTFDYDPC